MFYFVIVDRTEIRRRPRRTSVKARHGRSSGHAPAQMTEECMFVF